MSRNKTEKDSTRLVKAFVKKLNMSGIQVCSEPSNTECIKQRIIDGIHICLVPFKRK
jgi:hypothetical protein